MTSSLSHEGVEVAWRFLRALKPQQAALTPFLISLYPDPQARALSFLFGEAHPARSTLRVSVRVPPGPVQVLARKPLPSLSMQPSKLALTSGCVCPGDLVFARGVDTEDLRVSSALSGTPERTMKENCTCAAELLGTSSRDPLGLHHIPDSVPKAPAPLLPSWRAVPSHLQPLSSPKKQSHLEKSLAHTTRHHSKEEKCL